MSKKESFFVYRENLFVFRNSDSDDERWLSKLNASKWMKYVSKALRGAASMAKLLDFRNIQLAGRETEKEIIFVFSASNCRQLSFF